MRIVRVEIPSASLIALGLPVADMDINRHVIADVWLGYDGIARAVRVVR